jgi:predicted heme/steroid binding protein
MHNPQVNAKKLKGWRTLFVQNCFSLSESGHILQWETADLDRSQLVPKRLDMSAGVYDIDAADMAKAQGEMLKEGLPILASSLRYLVVGELNQEAVTLLSVMVFWDALMGVYRGDTAKIFKKNLLENGIVAKGKTVAEIQAEIRLLKNNIDTTGMSPEEIDELQSELRKNPPPLQHSLLGDNIAEFYRRFAEETKWGSALEVRQKAPTSLTTRSAGMMHPESGTIKYMKGDTEVTMVAVFNDKMTAYWQRLATYFGSEQFKLQFTSKDVGLMFVRNVEGYKEDRAIEAGKPPQHLLSSAWVIHLMHYQERYQMNLFGQLLEVFTLGADTGRVMTDHRIPMYMTSWPDLYILFMMDFTLYDISQKYASTDGHAIRGFLEGCSDNREMDFTPVDAPDIYSKFPDMGTLFKITMYKYYQSQYSQKADGKGNENTYLLDMMASGRYDTLAQNNVVTFSFLKAVMENLGNYKPMAGSSRMWIDVLGFNYMRVQGDDSLMTATARLSLSRKEWAEVVYNFKDMLEKMAAITGMKMARAKTIMRGGWMEFLKKMAVYGYFIPRFLQISPDDSENVDRYLDPVSRMVSRLAVWREWVFRGGSYNVAIMNILFEWNLSRVVIDTKTAAKVQLPFELLYVPKRYGGVGMLPWNFLDSNTDFLLMSPYYYPWEVETRRRMNAIVMAYQRVTTVDSVKAIADGLEDYFVNESPGGAYHYSSLDASRLTASEAAVRTLASRGYKVQRPYRLSRINDLRDAVRDSSKTKAAKSEDKIINSARLNVEYLKILNSGEEIVEMSALFPFIGELQILGRDAVPAPKDSTNTMDRTGEEQWTFDPIDLRMNPVAGFDSVLAHWTLDIGTSSINGELGTQALKVMRRLYDGIFPTRYRPEQIARDLLNGGIYAGADITSFLVASGANPSIAMSVGAALHNKLAQLKALSDLTMYSVAGEGFTDNSMRNVRRFIDLPTPEPRGEALQLMLSLGYQMSRADRLYNADGTYHRRRRFKLSISQSFLRENYSVAAGRATSSDFSALNLVGSSDVFSKVSNYGGNSDRARELMYGMKHDDV